MEKNQIVLDYLKKLFPNAVCELKFENDIQLLIAVILSAQCTDKRVNSITPQLFAKYKNAKDFKNAKQEELEQIIKPCGFFRSKAKYIKSACTDICEKYGGELPQNREDLEKLAGVGRKTANVVSSNLFDANVIAVDTHVLRVSNRLGYVNTNDPLKCEIELETQFKKSLKDLHHRLVLFGRYHCKARNPQCENCELKQICKYNSKQKG